MKIRFSKGELKRQRDALLRYERYLPTLQLKKQQLQMEILRQLSILEEKRKAQINKRKQIEAWVGLLADKNISLHSLIKPRNPSIEARNIAGVDLPVFLNLEFATVDYDLFTAPLWVDTGLEALKSLIAFNKEIETINSGIVILRHELRITTQRVNLFEKVKIPEAEEAIRLIKIYLGDQMANAVGRSKIAKRKIEIAEEEEILV